jgi:hypothetical protein
LAQDWLRMTKGQTSKLPPIDLTPLRRREERANRALTPSTSFVAMTKAEEYKKHAQSCRAMARVISNQEHRQGLIKMAETWESLAADRIAQIERQKRVDVLDGDHAESAVFAVRSAEVSDQLPPPE